MAETTKIEWTDATWNPITGCSVVSPGCTNCYAMKLAGTRLQHHPSRAGLTTNTKAGPVWNGKVRLNREWLHQPSEWKKPRNIFVCAHGDLFHEDVPFDWILDVLTVIACNPQHRFQVLTKRAVRMHAIMSEDDLLDQIYANWFGLSGGPREVWSWPLHNLWLGVSAEDDKRARERIPFLLDTPAEIRWLSAEPLLGPLSLNMPHTVGKLDWVVAGGESGPAARPMHPDWVRSLRDQCAASDIPFFFKQWGSWGRALPKQSGTPGRYAFASAGPHSEFWPQMVIETEFYPRQIDLFGGASVREFVGKKAAGRLLDGVEHNAMPEDAICF